jgi:hypothetical protein
MMKTSEISASYSDALNKLLFSIKKHFNTTEPQLVLSIFNDFLTNGLPLDMKPTALKEIFPLFECFRYWMNVSEFNTVQNNDKLKEN